MPQRTSVTFVCRNGKIFFSILTLDLVAPPPPPPPLVSATLRTVCGSDAVLLHATQARPQSHRDAFTARRDGRVLSPFPGVSATYGGREGAGTRRSAWTPAASNVKSGLLLEISVVKRVDAGKYCFCHRAVVQHLEEFIWNASCACLWGYFLFKKCH